MHIYVLQVFYPGFDLIRDIAFTWSMRNLVIHLLVYMITTTLTFLTMCQQRQKKHERLKVCPTCVCPDVLDVVALAVGEVGALAAGVQFAGEVIPQVFPPVVLTDGGVRTQSALKHPAETRQQHRH